MVLTNVIYVTTIVVTRMLNESHRAKTSDAFQAVNLKDVFDAKGANEVKCSLVTVSRVRRYF